MKTRQVVIGFEKPINILILVKVLKEIYGEEHVTIGAGQVTNGIPSNWIVVDNERRK
jgi:hypothetical protein